MMNINEILTQIKIIGYEYKKLTGKPLGVTGEIAELVAAKELKLELSKAREAGFDAIRKKDGKKIQIKGRCIENCSTKVFPASLRFQNLTNNYSQT